MSTKYPEIKQYILTQIHHGNYSKGMKLPPEKDFVQLFNVSRMTVRRAFDELIQEGALIRKIDSGVFVSSDKIETIKITNFNKS